MAAFVLSIPPIMGKQVLKLLKYIPAIFKAISKFSQKASEEKPITKDSTADEVERMAEILEEYRQEAQKAASEIENSVYKEVTYYVDELGQYLDDKKELLKTYGIRRKRIDRQIQRMLSGMKGFIDKEICRELSLGNPKLKDIIKMLPGTQKEQCMEKFLNQCIGKALNEYCRNFREILSGLVEELEEDILHVVEKAQENAETHSAELAKVNTENYIEKSEQIMYTAGCVMECCTVLEDIWRE